MISVNLYFGGNGFDWSVLGENLLISELANRAILLLEQLLIGEHYCTILQNNLIIASSLINELKVRISKFFFL